MYAAYAISADFCEIKSINSPISVTILFLFAFNLDCMQQRFRKMEMEEASVSQSLRGGEEDDEHDSKERVLQRYFLQEWKLVKSLLDDIVSARRVSDLTVVHKIRSIMDKYQEQGQLIEPYLESLVTPLIDIVRSRTTELGTASDDIMEVVKPICIIVYSLVTVCGYNSVIKFFPHQVSDLELAVSLLEKCHTKNVASSLRQEILIPFDISSVDTSIANSNYAVTDEPPPLVVRILEICKDYLSSAGPMRTIAGFLLSRLLPRPDMLKAFTSFIEWAHKILSSMEDNVMDHFRLLGAVEALAAIFKIGSTSVLLNVVPLLWNDTSTLIMSGIAARSPLLQKRVRISSATLSVSDAKSYRVVRKHFFNATLSVSDAKSYRVARNKILGENLSGYETSDCGQSNYPVNMNSCNISQEASCLQEEDMDVPDIIEDIIELMLLGLRDTDTVVRWSSAKGIGRVTSRLTYSLSDEVLSSILELFSPGEGDGSWHGGCLTLGELAR
ncbi:hypothetical protein ACS0TY_003631 [Phlomoides rotata]